MPRQAGEGGWLIFPERLAEECSRGVARCARANAERCSGARLGCSLDRRLIPICADQISVASLHGSHPLSFIDDGS